jgi:transcriptional regulator with XRE-family HTH domain
MLKKLIEEHYGNINKFCDQLDKEKLSRQTVYRLLTNKHPNPTLNTLIQLAKYLNINYIILVEHYKKILEGENNETI